MATRIYTKTGDDGTTALFGGVRVQKDDLRIEAYGTVDELSAVIGILRTHALPAPLKAQFDRIASDLFTLGADLATPLDPPPVYAIPRVSQSHVEELEHWIDEHEERLEPLKNFILPGGSSAAAYAHLARTVCRRAERCIVGLARHEALGDVVIHYVNRLSDFLFVAARRINAEEGVSDVPWTSTAKD
ncbi:MAG TPA: cob(I)yrinic acid a,c-diamide adenosyltransferase [Bacteroidetes bacterium]|nr:cob(I)yrinic acid a,c-diamide adenosyltransferase [Bacteroidota bacterium]